MPGTVGTPPAPADWLSSLPPSRHRLDAAGWALAAALVGGVAAGGVVLALWLDLRPGRDTRNEAALLIDLPPPPPAVSAVAETAPEAPLVEAPDSSDPGGTLTETPPDQTAPDPIAADASPAHRLPAPALLPPLPALAGLAPDDLAPPPPPPPPEPEPLPEPEPERPATPPKPQPKAEAKPKPAVTPKADRPPAASQASASAAARSVDQDSATQTATAGRVQDLRASWGAAIRKKIERRKSYPKGAGTATVQLTVTRTGALAKVALARSSGHPALDAAALAVVGQAGGFPKAPAGLTEASYVFTLPINFAP
jgi:protein TonB